MSKQFESPTVSLTPNGTMGFIDFEGEALINEIYRTVMEHKEVEWWLITNMIGPEEFPQHGPTISFLISSIRSGKCSGNGLTAEELLKEHTLRGF